MSISDTKRFKTRRKVLKVKLNMIQVDWRKKLIDEESWLIVKVDYGDRQTMQCKLLSLDWKMLNSS